jgi:PPOX class probable F420-dependent enzyme
VIHLTPEQRVFVMERHVATLTTLRPDGSPHVTPVAFAWDPDSGIAWMTSDEGSAKVRNIDAGARGTSVALGALCQVSGGRWLTLEGHLSVSREADDIAEAERRYAARYGPIDPDPQRVALLLVAGKVLGSSYMTR